MEYRRPLRLGAALVTAALLGSVVAGAATSTPAGAGADVAATTQAGSTWNQQMLDLVNAERATRDAGALNGSRDLNALAQAWAESIAAAGVMKHNPNLAGQLPAGYQAAGENVGWVSAPGSAAQFFQAWKASPSHYTNMTAAKYDNVGFGLAQAANGSWYGVQVFARYGRALDATATVFTDVFTTTQHAEHIVWLAGAGISTGYADGTFRPTQAVNRDAMAAFMYRLAGSPAFDATGRWTFVDVPPGTQFHKEIEWLAAEGISTGWVVAGGREFRPLAPVNRDAMAAFLYRLYGSPAFTAPSRSPFLDVSPGTQFYTEMAWLASNGISTGWSVAGGSQFRPLTAVNRDAMAAFMHRAHQGWGTPTP